MTDPKTRSSLSGRDKIVRVFVPLSIAYFLSYLYRNSNAVLAGDFTSELNIGAAELGLLTSAYFLSFAAFQFPLGVLLDRYGTRRVEGALVCLAGLGAWLFSLGTDVTSLFLARALIGLGVSACLMGAFRALGSVYSSGHLPMVNGLFLAIGSSGALAATLPLTLATEVYSWREIYFGLAVVTFAIAFTIFATLPRDFESLDRGDWASQISGLVAVLKDRNMCAVVPVVALVHGINLTWLSLWGGPWLRDVAGLQSHEVSTSLSVIVVGLIIGYACLGLTTKWLGRLGLTPIKITKLVCVLFILIYIGLAADLLPHLGAVGFYGLWFLFGVLSGSAMLVYAFMPNEFAPHLAGRVITFLNCAVFVMAFACQYGFGLIVDLYPITEAGGFAPEGYAMALWVWIGLMSITFIWMQQRYRDIKA